MTDEYAEVEPEENYTCRVCGMGWCECVEADPVIVQLQAENERLTRELHGALTTIDEHRMKVARGDYAWIDRVAVIRERDQALADRDATAAGFRQTIKERDEARAQLDQALKERDQERDSLKEACGLLLEACGLLGADPVEIKRIADLIPATVK